LNGAKPEISDVETEGTAMSWQKETHEKRLERFEQRLLSAQFDSKIVTCRSKAVESRVSGAGDDEDGDIPLLSLIEELARRIDGLERMTTNLSDELLLTSRRVHQMRSRFAVASLLLLSCGLLAGVWLKYTDVPQGAVSSTRQDRQDSTWAGRGMRALSALE
jgi:hypothetical protein